MRRSRCVSGRRCLIIGGRQSAFEWAALLAEAGALAVHVVHRHATPRFEPSDWTWVDALVDDLAANPDRYRLMAEPERQALAQRFWAEGRLKLEPWLGPRIAHEAIRLWPNDGVSGCAEGLDGTLTVDLQSGATIEVDEVIFATRYQPDARRLPLLARSDLFPELTTPEGSLVLDSCLQTRAPGLFLTSMSCSANVRAVLRVHRLGSRCGGARRTGTVDVGVNRESPRDRPQGQHNPMPGDVSGSGLRVAASFVR